MWLSVYEMPRGTGPAFFYEVEGVPGVHIRNAGPAFAAIVVWEIGSGDPFEWTGEFKTPEHALAYLHTKYRC
jgi:hypothetical protein